MRGNLYFCQDRSRPYLFEAVMTWIEANLMECLINGATFIDPDRRLDGYILFYEGEIKDGTGAVAGKRLFSFYANEKEVVPISPAVIWDLVEGEGSKENIDMEALKSGTATRVISKLEEYKAELFKERSR